MPKVKLLKNARINTKGFKKGDELNVSNSIFEKLTKAGEAEEIKSKKKK